VEAVKAGKIEFRADRTGCVHVIAGKTSFTEQAIIENCSAVIHAVHRAKPPASKGIYMLSCTVSTTMSPGIKLNLKEHMEK
jgi:large subunit ribosomal protein L1